MAGGLGKSRQNGLCGLAQLLNNHHVVERLKALRKRLRRSIDGSRKGKRDEG